MTNRVLDSFEKQGLMALLGARITRIEPGKMSIECEYREELSQQDGFFHAGVVSSIADVACGYAAYSLMEEGSRVLSVEFKINFLRPAKGKLILAEAKVIKPGSTLFVCEAEVNCDGKLCAKMQATMMCIAPNT